MSKRILIVEDEIGTGLALTMQVRRCAPESVIQRYGGCGSEFPEWLARQEAPPDVAIVDLQLIHRNGVDPDGGFQVLDHLKSKGVAAAVILVTGRDDRQAFERASGFKPTTSPSPVVAHYFTKPWSKAELNKAIRECLDQDREIGEIEVHGDVERSVVKR